jgi:dipeptidyl aminopeptidase/acylaminoacyl peptidase
VRQSVDLDNNRATSELHIALSYHRWGKQLTASGHRDTSPAWSPDASKIAFTSDRSGKRQLYILDPDGGEASLIATTQEPSGVPLWSPDGKSIAFVARVEMEPPAPFYEGAPPGRPGPSVRVIKTLHHKLDGVGFFSNSFTHVFVVPAVPTASGCTAEARQVTSGRYNHEKPAWSPDGKHLLVVANREEEDDDPFWNHHLWVCDVETGEMRSVFKEAFRVMGAVWSASGKIAFIATPHALTRLSDTVELFVMDFDAGKCPYSFEAARDLTSSLDRSVGNVPPSDTRLSAGRSLSWSSDDAFVYFVLASEGSSHVWRATADGKVLEKVTPGEGRAVACPSLSTNGWLSYTASKPDVPDEIFVLSPKGVERQVTTVNEAAACELSFARPERLLYAGADGWPVEGWLMKPVGASTGRKHPLVLTVHGGPHGMFGYGFNFQHQMLAGAGFFVLYTNPRASAGYGRLFHDAVEGDWGGGDFRDIMAGVDYVLARYDIDPDRTGIMGWSFGGYMTCWTVGQTARFKAAVAGACISNQHDRWGTSDIGPEDVETSVKGAMPFTDATTLLANSPVSYAGNVTTPLLLICGEEDLRCPISQTEQMFIALKRQGKTAVFVRYPGEYHGLARPSNVLDRLERMKAWFSHYLS